MARQSKKSLIKVDDLIYYWKVLEIPNAKHKASCLCTGCNKTIALVYYMDLIKGKRKSCGCQKGTERKKTNLERYRTNDPSKNKREQTILEKYGVKSVFQLGEFQERGRQTCVEKFGTPYYNQSQSYQDKLPEIQQKIKQTMVEKYGEDSFAKTPQFKEQYVETCRKRYGVNHPYQLDEIKQKRVETCLEKYGVENYTRTEECQKKIAKTNIEKYGAPATSQTAWYKELMVEKGLWFSEEDLVVSIKD